MLDRDCGQGFILFKKNDQNTQDAICLARAKFYTDLHQKVAYGLLSIADAEKAVTEYNHPTPTRSQPISDTILAKLRIKSRERPLLKSVLSTE